MNEILCRGLLIAPMAGVTDAAYRAVCRVLGATGLAYTEMVSAKGLCYGDKKSFEIARVRASESPISIQLFGADPGCVAEAAARVVELNPDVFAIDVNMGCPMPKITKNGEGSALMRTPALAAGIVRAVARAVNKPVTVKMRKGWDGESSDPVRFALAVQEAGAAMICVHGRTRDQLYKGRADWGAIAAVKRAVSVPVVGNGDVATPEDARRMIAETGCDAVMVGRAAQGNPWVFTPSGARRDADGLKMAMRLHLKLAVEEKGERAAVLEMRKHFAWYIKGLRGAAALKNEMFGATDAATLERFIESRV